MRSAMGSSAGGAGTALNIARLTAGFLSRLERAGGGRGRRSLLRAQQRVLVPGEARIDEAETLSAGAGEHDIRGPPLEAHGHQADIRHEVASLAGAAEQESRMLGQSRSSHFTPSALTSARRVVFQV